MTLDDFSIYGISASLLISLISIAIALFAVYFTYKQAKISHNQFELELKKVENPRILEILHNPLNTILHEMDIELRAIGEADLLWFVGNERNNFYVAPLVFPISPKKEFSVGFRQMFTGPEYIPTEKFSQIIWRVDDNLKRRYDDYRSIDKVLSNLEGNIRQDGIDQRVNALLSKLETLKLEQNSDYYDIVFRIDPLEDVKQETISKKQLDDIIVSMVISTLFKPLKIDEIRLGCLGYGYLTAELFPHIENSILELPVPDAAAYKKRVLTHLASLKGIDESIRMDIDAMKEIYREKYILTEAELDPYHDPW